MLVALALFTSLLAEDEPPKQIISPGALSAEQIAIYRTVLAEYSKNFPGQINLADTTDPFNEPSEDEVRSCMRERETKGAAERDTIVHRLDPSVVVDLKFVLVDPHLQAEKVKQNDPQKLLGHGSVTEDQIGKAVNEAFHAGLFTLSEIAFDADHQRALVSYGFWCGRLCGHGALLRLKKNGTKWKIAKICVSWVS